MLSMTPSAGKHRASRGIVQRSNFPLRHTDGLIGDTSETHGRTDGLIGESVKHGFFP